MNYDDRYFRAPWGTSLKVISASVSLLVIGIFWWAALQDQTPDLPRFLFALVPFVLLPGFLLTIIRGYTISGNVLKIKRLLRSNTVDLTTLRSSVHDPQAMKGSIRTMGNGGLYSFSGRYRSKKLGSYIAYVNDFNNCVILVCSSRTVVISPENPEMFVEILNNREQ